MAMGCVALLNVTVKEVTAKWLLAKIISHPNFAHTLIEHYRHYWTPQIWEIEWSELKNAEEVKGPGGFVIDVSPSLLVVRQYVIKFSAFTHDAEAQQLFRRTCFEIATWVGSSKAIFTHELMPYEEQTLAKIENHLRTEIGVPAATIEEMKNVDYFEAKTWYVDSFDDLRVTPLN